MRELIERIKNDDVDAVEELYGQVYAKGIKIAASYVGKEGLEEDMFHEAFMKAIGNLDKFDESRSFQAWFDVILANTCKSYLRRKKPELMSEYADEDGETDEAFGELSTIGNPEENWDQKELRQIIKGLLEELSEEQREAVILYYYQNMPVSEIAEHQNCSQETVKSRLFQARNKLKVSIEAYEKKTNTKLHNIGIVVALLAFFKSDMGKSYACEMGAGTPKQPMSDGGSTTATKMLQKKGEEVVMKNAAKSAAMKLSTKILIGVVSVGVIGGAVALGVTLTGDGNPKESQVVMGTTDEGNQGASGTVTPEPTPEVTPEPTPEPTPSPTPVPTEVTLRTSSKYVFSENGEYLDAQFPTIEGEFPDTSKTIAEMFFYIPEGMTLTYEFFCENMPSLFDDYWLPGGKNWDYPSRSNDVSTSCAGLYYLLSDEYNQPNAKEDNWEGYFGHGMTKEEWNSIFTLIREKRDYGGVFGYSNVVDIKISEDDLINLFMELINNYSYDQIYEMYGSGDYVDWSTASDDYKKYIYFADSFLFDYFVGEREVAAHEAYKADSTGWIDYNAYMEDWDAMSDDEKAPYMHEVFGPQYYTYFMERYNKEIRTTAQ